MLQHFDFFSVLEELFMKNSIKRLNSGNEYWDLGKKDIQSNVFFLNLVYPYESKWFCVY